MNSVRNLPWTSKTLIILLDALEWPVKSLEQSDSTRSVDDSDRHRIFPFRVKEWNSSAEGPRPSEFRLSGDQTLEQHAHFKRMEAPTEALSAESWGTGESFLQGSNRWSI